LTEESSALLGFAGELPGVPVVDELVPDWPEAAPVVPLVPESPVEPVLPFVALLPIEELSLAPLVESVVLQAASATQNAAANIVFISAMIFSLYKRVETIRLEALSIYKAPLDGRAFELRQHFCRKNATHVRSLWRTTLIPRGPGRCGSGTGVGPAPSRVTCF
jgi:hypothetical protein